MTSKSDYLERIYVASSCKSSWDGMTGTDHIRHCAECNRQVYDLSKMTRRQAEHLIRISRGRMCARISRSPDGAIITQEESPAFYLITRRASPVTAAVVGAAISIGSGTPALATVPRAQAQISVVPNGKNAHPDF